MVSSRVSVFELEFREDLRYWIGTERRVAVRLMELVESIMRDPFQGLGKPEPLKHLGAGIWSRRITREHRVIYVVTREAITFLKARYHY